MSTCSGSIAAGRTVLGIDAAAKASAVTGIESAMCKASVSPGRQVQVGGEDWVMPSFASSASLR